MTNLEPKIEVVETVYKPSMFGFLNPNRWTITVRYYPAADGSRSYDPIFGMGNTLKGAKRDLEYRLGKKIIKELTVDFFMFKIK